MDIMGPGKLDGMLQQAQSRSAQQKLQDLEGRSDAGQDLAALEETARQFEGVFLNTLMKSMRSTVPDNELFNSGGATKFYQQMQDAEMAKAMASGHTRVGIADLIVNQFKASAEGVDPTAGMNQPVPMAQHAPVLDRYRSMGQITGQAADRLRLRMQADAAGPAVADTLRRFESDIMGSAERHGLDPALVLAVVMQESGGDPMAVSPKGATGLMQLMPGTAQDMGVGDATSPAQNLDGGSRYLSGLLKRYEGDLNLALAAYNAGPGHVDRAGKNVPDFPETRNYVQRVGDLYRKLGGTILANSQENEIQERSTGDLR